MFLSLLLGSVHAVAHVEVGQRRQLLGEGGIAAPPPRRGSTGLPAAAPTPGTSAATACSAAGPTQSSAKATGAPIRAAATSATGRRLISGTRFPSGRPRCNIGIPPCACLRQVLDGGQRLLDALVALDLAVLEGDVEVDAHDDALAAVFRSSTNSFFPVLMPRIHRDFRLDFSGDLFGRSPTAPRRAGECAAYGAAAAAARPPGARLPWGAASSAHTELVGEPGEVHLREAESAALQAQDS